MFKHTGLQMLPGNVEEEQTLQLHLLNFTSEIHAVTLDMSRNRKVKQKGALHAYS